MVSKDFGIYDDLIICIASVALFSTATIFLPGESFGQTPDFTSASVRGFFDEDTGAEIQPPPDTFPIFPNYLILKIVDVPVRLRSMCMVFGPMKKKCGSKEKEYFCRCRIADTVSRLLDTVGIQTPRFRVLYWLYCNLIKH